MSKTNHIYRQSGFTYMNYEMVLSCNKKGRSSPI